MGLQFTEDRGLRLINGGCLEVAGEPDCFFDEEFPGLNPYADVLGANIRVDETGELFLPERNGPSSNAYSIQEIDGVKVAFIGLARTRTDVISGSRIAGLSFEPYVETVSALVPEILEQGVRAIVVLTNKAVIQDQNSVMPVSSRDDDDDGGSTIPIATRNTCLGILDPEGLFDDVRAFHPEVDLVLAGQSESFVCDVDGTPVVAAGGFGVGLSDIKLKIKRRTGEVKKIKIKNRPLLNEDSPLDPEATALVARYFNADRPEAETLSQIVGAVEGDINRGESFAGESELGNVYADASLAATAEDGAVIAFENSGGYRTGIFFNASAAGEAPGEVSNFEILTVTPFGRFNFFVVLSLTPEQLDAVLEDSVGALPNPNAHSAGFSYAWDLREPIGNRVDPSSITFNGGPLPLDQDGRIRIAVNSFMATGGSNNPTLLRLLCDALGSGVNGRCNALDPLPPAVGDPVLAAELNIALLFGKRGDQALRDYLEANAPVPEPALDRLIRLDPDPDADMGGNMGGASAGHDDDDDDD